MKLTALMPARNEDWILGLSARAVMRWVDSLIILDHCSTDRTRRIAFEVAAEYPGRVITLCEEDPVWEEMRHRQILLATAREHGATHIALVDADEVLSGNLLPTIRQKIAATPAGSILQVPWLCLRNSIDQYHASGIWAQQDVSMAFADDPVYHWTAREGYDFHHRHPMGRHMPPYRPVRDAPFRKASGGLMHLQFVSDRRLRAKQALYKLTELIRWPGREPVRAVDERYNLAVYGTYRPAIGGDKTGPANWQGPFMFAIVPEPWWAPYADLMPHLHVDAEPWQEAECKRLWAEHGAEKFAGLDLFGVVG